MFINQIFTKFQVMYSKFQWILCQNYFSQTQNIINPSNLLLITLFIKNCHFAIYFMGNYTKTNSQSLTISVRSGNQIQGRLFDYSLPLTKLLSSQLTIQRDGYLNDNYGTVSQSLDDEPLINSFARVEFRNHGVIRVESLTSEMNNEKLWIYPGINPVMINEGDEIKLGRFEFKVKKIQFNEQNYAKSCAFRASFIEKNIELTDSRIPQCRICFMSAEEHNELISPCSCSGSQQFIHLKCLRDWLATKVQNRQDSISQVIISQPLKCEVCGSFFKSQFDFQDKKMPLLKMKHIPAPYLLLQGSKVNDISKVTVSMKLVEGRETSVGRQTNNDVVLSEISVSRNHCSFVLENGNVYIKDKQSKFGTLTRPAQFSKINGRLTLQYNNMVVDIMQPPSMVSSCCNFNSLLFQFES